MDKKPDWLTPELRRILRRARELAELWELVQPNRRWPVYEVHVSARGTDFPDTARSSPVERRE